MNRKIPVLLCGVAIFAACVFSLRRPQTASPPPVARAYQKAETIEVAFDAERAFALLKAQCDFGPRHNGSAAHEKTAAFLAEQMRPLMDEWTTQKWNQKIARGPGAGRTFAMTNLLGIIRGTEDENKKLTDLRPALMLSAHWDTRPVADQDTNPRNRKTPIVGANDGASGVAVVLEIARVLHEKKPRQTIVFALWDGEDLGEFFYGAKHFALLSKTPVWKSWKPVRGILLDMVGDADLQITREQNSMKLAPELWEEVQDAATELDKSEFFNGAPMNVLDDHIPLNQAGIPTIDLIDFNYPHWHTLEDTPDKCSPESLKIVGDVVLRVIENNGKTKV